MEGDVQLSAKILNCRHFNPLPPHGGRPGISFILFTILSFQSTPSAWRETSILPGGWKAMNHFNPLPPHGGRQITSIDGNGAGSFQSTPSAWRETRFSYTQAGWHVISIHSLRMEGDRRTGKPNADRIYFNPLPPHGGRLCFQIRQRNDLGFQSTPSAWRETCSRP